MVGFKPSLGAINRGGSHDGLSQSCHGALAASLADAWQVVYEIAVRAGGDPGFPGLVGPPSPPAPVQPRRLALLETDAWAEASSEAKAQLDAAVARLRARGVEIVARAGHAGVAAVEQALSGALALAFRLHAWECRWPLNTYRDRDAGKLSKIMLQRLAEAEAMTPADYRAALAERARVRAVYARACARLRRLRHAGRIGAGAASGCNRPAILSFAAPSSLLGAPAVSLPLLTVDGMPVGLQVMGFEQRDAALFGVAAWIERGGCAMKLAVPDMISNSYFPAEAAIELGFMREQGLDVALELIFPVDKAYEALRDGAVDFVAGSAHSALAAFPDFNGAKLLCAQAQGMYWFLVLHKDFGAKRGDLEVLKGRNIGAAPWVDMGLKRLLIAAGLDLERDRIRIAPVPGAQGSGVNFGLTAARALEERKIDGFWANGMAAEIAVTRGVGTVVLDVRRGDGPPEAFNYTMASVATTDRLIEEQPEIAAAAVRAIVKTQAALRSDVTRAAQVGRALFPENEAGLIAELIRARPALLRRGDLAGLCRRHEPLRRRARADRCGLALRAGGGEAIRTALESRLTGRGSASL